MEQDNQLLKDFSDAEKGAYLSAIASIATADRKATEDEIEFLEALADSADLPSDQEQLVMQAANDPSNTNLQSNLDILKNSQLRFSLLTDVISFAKADGVYTPEEQQRVQQIATYLNIDQTQYNALNQFVDTAETAQKQGQDVSGPNFLESSGLSNTMSKLGISPSFLKGALAVMAPILISRMMNGGGRRGRVGGIGMGSTPSGGLLGGLLGGVAGSMLGKTSAGGMLGGSGGGLLGSSTGVGGMRSGGLGSLFSIFGGGKGYGNYGGIGGGLSSVLGGLLGSRRGGGLFQ
ncbi:TerB family tellurite resistance protein [Rhodocytophaga rosea]|uniref:TerB family tellurite resistance protein n=1 Tax=Rhodocytophaga rosea TaxID=2704465 RepID=A0A6C0GQ92_9BACT|nr:TerB family tellurite resistance protein [Rhodocytophaga rosea]QHT70229.1 TerB family tellurite resistance protein [Rhodocytophaga rosea]